MNFQGTEVGINTYLAPMYHHLKNLYHTLNDLVLISRHRQRMHMFRIPKPTSIILLALAITIVDASREWTHDEYMIWVPLDILIVTIHGHSRTHIVMHKRTAQKRYLFLMILVHLAKNKGRPLYILFLKPHDKHISFL